MGLFRVEREPPPTPPKEGRTNSMGFFRAEKSLPLTPPKEGRTSSVGAIGKHSSEHGVARTIG